MKNKNKNKKIDYSKLKRKLYQYILTIVMAAVVFVLFLRLFIQGTLGEWIVRFLENSYHLERWDAMIIYQYTIRNNIEIFIYVAVAISILILCRVMLLKFVKYFEEINTGIDILIQNEDKQIELSAELEFMEQKLNTLKRTLEKREHDAKLAEQRKNEVVMYLAHDIKTPLTSVIGYLILLDEAPDMPREQKAKYVHITLDKAYRLEQLIDEFFEITRYNLQTITLTKKHIDLYYMLVQMTDEFYPQLAAKGKQVVLHVSEDLTVFGDADKLARVFNNILKNATAYSKDDSVIDITANLSEDVVSIVFKNDGNIPKDKLATIFEQFYRLDDARSSDTGGAGLGLAIAKEIIVQHGGQIYAESNDNSTIFTVELPVFQDSVNKGSS
ncbi:vancomycin resistance histidine kinase VanS [Bacillus cereus group sp. BfR-BA-00331]|uniref:vancomycin resistance histidine kinase VanS n=1 Tax=Bacillus cereus group TaxID=86661 RepID=UPI000772A0DA|nr:MULTISPECIES: vancomycin resistance histidine kinase VanS [Bacillus cereus group]ONG62022.1 vancomycin resistance histidine kinase VanS [Bacillus cereus]MDA1617310.1 HAMP domain-containing sensor histidine kinase [Bacillus cereus group sp. TH204-1LC]MDA1915606.1 HAMP domain-containing sensor histidine kinase [Bacillus cereus group sp. BcHK140]MDA2195096.1 HAMP domain-containing sensor histidine kinase [Bacillus cereus group sp. Bc238]MDA2200891.1 HAMP domain-containing sensor histidine kina